MTRKPRQPQTVQTIVQNWLGLTRFETDQVLTVMAETDPDYDAMTVTEIRTLSEEAMECLNENRMLGRAVWSQP